MKIMSGVYVIENTINGQRYVGSSSNVYKRWNGHQYALQKGIHHSQHLQLSWNKYGKESFLFKPLLWCDEKSLFLYEQTCIDVMRPEYNIAACAEASMRGVVFSEEHKAKIGASCSIAHKGKHLTEEHKRNISEANKGKLRTEETKRRMSEAQSGANNANYGKHLTVETKAKLSETLTGRVMSEESKRKISQAMIGNINSTGNVLTDIHKQRIGNSNRGKKRSEETKRNIGLSKVGNTYRRGVELSAETIEKLRLSHLGNTPSDETRAKMSEAQKVRWQIRKASEAD